MNANSPICTSEKPLWMELCSEFPVTRKLRLPNTICPRVTASEMTRMGHQYCMSTEGSTIMPTDTKKTAPKRSFSGDMVCSMRSASMVSDRMLPIMKAPKAAL